VCVCVCGMHVLKTLCAGFSFVCWFLFLDVFVRVSVSLSPSAAVSRTLSVNAHGHDPAGPSPFPPTRNTNPETLNPYLISLDSCPPFLSAEALLRPVCVPKQA
jgi:hypothetical protein